jgi:hypothetical protein
VSSGDHVLGRELAMDPITGGLLVFLVVFLASIVLMAGLGVAVCRGVRKERRLREG